MTRAQFAALLSAAGVGFVGGATLDFRPGPPATATFVHALRIEGNPDSGDIITAYRTRATYQGDGGMGLVDIGPATCTGDTSPVRTWLGNCRKEDGGQIKNVYVLEARPTGVDDGGAGNVAVEVYGDAAIRCTLSKSAGFRNFLGSLTCKDFIQKSSTTPL